MKKSLLLAGVLLGLVSASNAQVTQAEQKAMSPDAILQEMMAGNARFVAGTPEAPEIKSRIATSSKGQFPIATVLSCLDSRVPVELVFDQGVGDIFVGRVAGNVSNGDQLGSMEFATKLAGTKLIFVLGHSSCGAVKGACDGAKLGNLTGLLAKIQPAVDAVKGHEEAGRNSKNKKFVAAVVEQNVIQALADIRKDSPVLAEMEKAGEIKIVGGIYSLETGKVTLLK